MLLMVRLFAFFRHCNGFAIYTVSFISARKGYYIFLEFFSIVVQQTFPCTFGFQAAQYIFIYKPLFAYCGGFF